MGLLDVIFPSRCVGCGRLGKYICDRCAQSIQAPLLVCACCAKPAIDGVTHARCKGRFSLDQLLSFVAYNGVVKQAIKAIKYRLVTDMLDELSFALTPFIQDKLKLLCSKNSKRYVLVPIPLHRRRRKERGFNQSEIFANIIAKTWFLPVGSNIIMRSIYTEPQVSMKIRQKRLRNVQDVFCVNDDALLTWKNHTIVLFDDIWTTGATMKQACKALKQKGVRRVVGITLAR